MSIYKRFCREHFDESGNLTEIKFEYGDNFNFGYDVVDAIADETPDKTAIVWCNTENSERIMSFADLRKESNKVANVFRTSGLKKGDCVMVILKRHLEYWIVAIALHKLGITMIPATHMLTVHDLESAVEAFYSVGKQLGRFVHIHADLLSHASGIKLAKHIKLRLS